MYVVNDCMIIQHQPILLLSDNFGMLSNFHYCKQHCCGHPCTGLQMCVCEFLLLGTTLCGFGDCSPLKAGSERGYYVSPENQVTQGTDVTSFLTPRVPMGIRPDKYIVSFEACFAWYGSVDTNWMFKFRRKE